MFTVLSRPYDDDEIVEVYIAEHDNHKKTLEQFEVEWMQARDIVMEKNPEYDVSAILIAMKRKGWSIIHTTPAKVTY